MVLDDNIRERQEPARLLVDFLSFLRPAFADGPPVLHRRWRISVAAVVSFPSPRVDILSAAKQASKQCNPFSSALFLIDRYGGVNGLSRSLRYELGNRDAMSC